MNSGSRGPRRADRARWAGSHDRCYRDRSVPMTSCQSSLVTLDLVCTASEITEAISIENANFSYTAVFTDPVDGLPLAFEIL